MASAFAVLARRSVPIAACAAVLSVRSALAAPLDRAAPAQAERKALELSSSFSELIVLGPLSGRASTAVGLEAQGLIHRAWWWGGGARMVFGPATPEFFGRLSALTDRGTWRPSVSLELGLSWVARQAEDEALLADMRELSRDGLVPLYVALHGAPLRFVVFDAYRLSLLELGFGTHVAPLGRFARLDVTILSIGVAP